MSAGGSSGTSTTQLDPQVKGAWLDLYNQAQQTAAQGTPQQSVADFTPTGIAGQLATIGAAGAGSGTLSDAVARTQAVGSTGPAYASSAYAAPAAAGGVTTQSAPDSAMLGFRDVNAPTFDAAGLSQYENPYTNDVINSTISDLDRSRKIALNGAQSGLTGQGGEGAWNGARAGVERGQIDDAFLRNVGQVSSNLRNTMFDTATGLQKDYGAAAQQAQTTNQGADLTRGQTAYGGTLSTNQKNQDAINQILEANAQREQQAGQFNASAANDTSKFNAGQGSAWQDLALRAAGQEAGQAGQQQSQALTGAGAISSVGDAERQLLQQGWDTDYSNLMTQRNLPLQTEESAFGIIPSTGSGSVTHSSGKTGQI